MHDGAMGLPARRASGWDAITRTAFHNMSRRSRIGLIAFLLLLLVAALVAWKMTLPKPQLPFASLEPAPDFTLNDQDGKPFTLSSLRGARVVLVFYRGYW